MTYTRHAWVFDVLVERAFSSHVLLLSARRIATQTLSAVFSTARTGDTRWTPRATRGEEPEEEQRQTTMAARSFVRSPFSFSAHMCVPHVCRTGRDLSRLDWLCLECEKLRLWFRTAKISLCYTRLFMRELNDDERDSEQYLSRKFSQNNLLKKIRTRVL